MRIGVPRETAAGERRVATVPETVAKLRALGVEVLVESGAGSEAFASDEEYILAGAKIQPGDVLGDADIVLTVQPLAPEAVDRLKPGALTAGFLPASAYPELLPALAARKVTALSLERLPRITRAQSMDALSSQALVAGYRATLRAAERLPRFLPLFMTAAGTVRPAKVLVLGAGVAGLQAIATARRLGAVVSAYDVRVAAGEEVRSLGATFLELPLESQEGAGGYAAAQTEDFLRRQRELIGAEVAKSDVVITTAAIPGRRAPVLVTTDMVDAMPPGSVIVDLAAETGGNCELTVAGEDVRHSTVTVVGPRNLPSEMPMHASALYARNVVNLVTLLVRDGDLALDFDDEIVASCCVTHAGEIRVEVPGQ
ncbi:MAG: Re/Si-specific NAD(P)(+) transhydrogenase subunit alpha [Mycobacterium leprae]